MTFLTALLPGYKTLELGSYLLLVLLRFVDGIFLGGGDGYTGIILLAIEYAKTEKRGFVGSFIIADFPAAYISISLITMLMFAFSSRWFQLSLCTVGLTDLVHYRCAACRGAGALLCLQSVRIGSMAKRRW